MQNNLQMLYNIRGNILYLFIQNSHILLWISCAFFLNKILLNSKLAKICETFYYLKKIFRMELPRVDYTMCVKSMATVCYQKIPFTKKKLGQMRFQLGTIMGYFINRMRDMWHSIMKGFLSCLHFCQFYWCQIFT